MATAQHRGFIQLPLKRRIEDTDVGGAAARECACLQPEDAGRLGCRGGDQPRQRHDAALAQGQQ